MIPWADARATVLTAYGAFSPKMAEVADQFFAKKWIDAAVRPGKQPGAFAHPTVPSAHPYVLLNYQGKPRDVMTLAHEPVSYTHLITNTLAKDKEISDRWRGFKDVADARHLSNHVEPEVVEALVSAVRAAYPKLSHRYYTLKAKWFGKKSLPYWDRNAPLPKVAPVSYTHLGSRPRSRPAPR